MMSSMLSCTSRSTFASPQHSFLLVGAVVLAMAGCTGDIDSGSPDTDGGGRSGDAAPRPDADPSAPDADPSAPDAALPRPDAAPILGEPPGLEGITQAHNDARADVGVGPMVWDPDLALVAQTWAEKCIDNENPIGLIDHNAGRSDTYPGYVGENIYGSSGGATGVAAAGLWIAEKPDYDYATNTCAQGKVCGHYTQVVWAASVRLGCGIYTCPGVQYGSAVVCNYSPGGNSGGKPY